ncbi:MAG: thioredoxin family protein [Phototrophicales bacterium]|nr:thioredoxin family protein [Phototrophicales bacterium]
MLDRVIIVGALLIIGFGLFLWFQYRQKGRITQLDNSDKVLNQLMKGKPAIIYFSMHNCIPCHTQQRPALNKLESQLGDKVQIIEVNTTENPDIAQKWGVFSAPTTIVLDGYGKTQHINYGATATDKLIQQIGI